MTLYIETIIIAALALGGLFLRVRQLLNEHPVLCRVARSDPDKSMATLFIILLIPFFNIFIYGTTLYLLYNEEAVQFLIDEAEKEDDE